MASGSSVYGIDAQPNSVIRALAINRVPGVAIFSNLASIYASHIGTDPTGTIALPNSGGIGGSGRFGGNLISSNLAYGIRATGGVIGSNRLGTDVTGRVALGRSNSQIETSYGSEPLTITDNVIGGAHLGISIYYATKVTISGNFIGIARTGEGIGSFGNGIAIYQSNQNVISGNTIASHPQAGVHVSDGSIRNQILGNSIFDNAFGIDLSPWPYDGVTPNDSGDTDTGPNNFTNYPVITGATSVDGNLTVTGSLASIANRTFTIELFVSPACAESGYGEGKTKVVTFTAGTNASGILNFTQSLPMNVPSGHVITATATSAEEGTSEFSACRAVEGRGRLSFTDSDIVLSEANSGPVAVTVRRTDGSVGPATITYQTADGTAKAGLDYLAASGTLQFADGESEKTIALQVINDSVFEGDQTFTLTLSNATGAALGSPHVAHVTIDENDQVPSVSLAGSTAFLEGDSGIQTAQITLTLSSPSEVPLPVSYLTHEGTANAGVDYNDTAGSVTFAPGEMQKNVALQLLGDTNFEYDEYFEFAWKQPPGGGSAAAIIIKNDDEHPTVTIADVSVDETDGATNAILTVVASAPFSGYIGYATIAGTATADLDYERRYDWIYFDQQTTQTISIPIHGDDVPEAHEQFSVHLTANGNNYVLADEDATVTILDDDIGIGPEELQIPVGDSRDGVIQAGGAATSDTTFTLTTSTPGIVRVPATVVLPAGSSRINFDVEGLAPGEVNVLVHVPPSIGGGVTTIRVTTYVDAELTLTPDQLTVTRGNTVTVHASLRPVNTQPLRIRLTGSDTVAIESFTMARMLSVPVPWPELSKRRLRYGSTAPSGVPSPSTKLRARSWRRFTGVVTCPGKKPVSRCPMRVRRSRNLTWPRALRSCVCSSSRCQIASAPRALLCAGSCSSAVQLLTAAPKPSGVRDSSSSR